MKPADRSEHFTADILPIMWQICRKKRDVEESLERTLSLDVPDAGCVAQLRNRTLENAPDEARVAAASS